MNLCVVIDRSGSMEGSIGQCKKALENIIHCLQPDDCLHLVVYDDRVDTVFQNKRKQNAEEMLDLVSAVKARGSTDIQSGLAHGINILLQSECVGTKAVFLFSDGLANVGETDGQRIGLKAQELCSNAEIAISTFGIGNSYDEKLLRTIANLGRGSYYYIEDSEKIPHVVQHSIGGLANFWSTDARLFVQGTGGTVVKEVTGFSTLLTPKCFKIREMAFIQHLATVVHLPNGGPSQRGEVKVHLNFTDFDGQTVSRRVQVHYDLLEVPPTEVVEHSDVFCYLRMLACSDVNRAVSDMIMDRKPASEVIAKKQKIVAMYEEALPKDRFCILAPILKRELETLEEFISMGVYTESAQKKFGYYAAKAGGYQDDAYDVGCEDDEEDCDMGFDLFC